MPATGCLRRFTGPQADEIAILCRPDGEARDVAAQVESAYRALAERLAANGATFAHVAAETVFLRDVGEELRAVLATRKQVLADLAAGDQAPPPALVGQPPVDGAALALAAVAVVPRDPDDWSTRDVELAPSCPCAGCARSAARVVSLGEQRALHATPVYGVGDDVYAQASTMFVAAERLLEACGMSFHDVVRTWIHLRDIDRDYDALNAARRDFFASRGIGLRPASTGVGGLPATAAHACGLSFHALRMPRSLPVTDMTTPLLNEAWSYGADFSRGLRVVDANKVALYVSGTASIGAAGETLHVGDFAAQAERMLDNIASLLERQGAGFHRIVSAVTYLRQASDAATLHEVYRRRGFGAFPCAVVEAPLCRPELLCETEALALLPHAEAAAESNSS